MSLKENAAKVGRKLTGRQSRIDDNIRILDTIYNTFIKELDEHSVGNIDFGDREDIKERFGCVSKILTEICNSLRGNFRGKMKTSSSLYKWFDKFLSMLTDGNKFTKGIRETTTGFSSLYIDEVVNFFSFEEVKSLKFFSSLNSKEFKNKLTTDTNCTNAVSTLKTWLRAAFYKASTVEKDINANTNQINTSNQRFS